MSKHRSIIRQQFRNLQITIRDLERQPYGMRTSAWHDARRDYWALVGRGCADGGARAVAFEYLRRAAEYRHSASRGPDDKGDAHHNIALARQIRRRYMGRFSA